MKLTCREANEIIQSNEQEMKQIESLLKKMPKEDLRCAKNGKNYKWFCMKEGSVATYLPKSNRRFAEKLVLDNGICIYPDFTVRHPQPSYKPEWLRNQPLFSII